MVARKTYHHGDLRRTLLQAASDIVRSRGLDGLSLRAVARKAKVSHAAPYHHFPDRAGLLAAVAEQGFVDLKHSMEEQIGALRNSKDKLEAAGSGYVLFAFQNPLHFRLMFGAELADKSKFPNLREAATQAHEVLIRLAAECQAEKVIRQGDPKLISLSMWAIVHGLAMLFIDRQFGADALSPAGAKKLTRDIKHYLWVGLTP